jgi:hypothetical protein
MQIKSKALMNNPKVPPPASIMVSLTTSINCAIGIFGDAFLVTSALKVPEYPVTSQIIIPVYPVDEAEQIISEDIVPSFHTVKFIVCVAWLGSFQMYVNNIDVLLNVKLLSIFPQVVKSNGLTST